MLLLILNYMKFTFKIGAKIKEAWPLYKENLGAFLILLLITFVSSSLGGKNNHILGFVLFFVNILISYIWICSILNLLDGKKFDPFVKETFPDLRQYWNFLSTGILSFIIIFIGFIFLIVPGLYFAGRLMFASYIALEKNQNAVDSIKESWDITKGYSWKIFGKAFIIGLFILAGFIALFVGSFITYPVGMIVFVMLYREFKKWRLVNPVPVESKSEEKKEEVKVEIVKEADVMKEEVK